MALTLNTGGIPPQIASQTSGAQSRVQESLGRMSTGLQRLSTGLKLNSSEGNTASAAIGAGGLRLPERTTGGLINRTDQYLPPPVAAAGADAKATAGDGAASAAAAGADSSTAGESGAANAASTGMNAAGANTDAAQAQSQAGSGSFQVARPNYSAGQTNAADARKQLEGLQSAESSLKDTDYAAEIEKFTNAQIRNQAATTALSQANQASQPVLSLLQGR